MADLSCPFCDKKYVTYFEVSIHAVDNHRNQVVDLLIFLFVSQEFNHT